MVSILLFYPETIRFNDMYYLHLKIENRESDKEMCFRIIKEKKLLQEFTIAIQKRRKSYFYKLHRNIFDSGDSIKLFYEKNGRNYLIDTLYSYDCLIINENELSYRLINEMKKDFLNELRGIKKYG